MTSMQSRAETDFSDLIVNLMW